jgi:hypothetical protein
MISKQRKLKYLKIVTPYLDKNFSIPLEPKEVRLERESELILGYELLQNKYDLRKKLSNEGPDFLLIYKNKKVWIEVITPNEGSYPIFKNDTNVGTGGLQEINVENCKQQIASGIKAKKDKYILYQQKKIVNADDIKIIGINVYNLDSGMETCPFVVSVLYNKREIWFFDSKTNKKETEFVKHPPIQKPSGNKVYLGLFDQADYQCIDGVLWFDYSLGTIIPEKCNVQFLANRGRKKKIDGLFSCWECVLYEDGWLIRQKLYPA